MANIRARLKFENKLAEHLKHQGYQCLRSAGSRGPVDIIAVNEDHVRAIQLKTMKHSKRQDWDYYMLRDAVLELLDFPTPSCLTVELWVKPLYRNWRYIIIEHFPIEKNELLKTLKEIDWIEA